MSTAIVWLRRDLRLADNPALSAALEWHSRVLALFVWAPDEEEPWSPGAVQRVWLHHSLPKLGELLRERRVPLIIRRGTSLHALKLLAAETGASAVYWNRLYEPRVVERDTVIKAALLEDGLEVNSFNGSLLCEPWQVATRQGSPFRVFTPFSNVVKQQSIPEPIALPERIPDFDIHVETLDIEVLELLSSIRWDRELIAHWTPGEAGASELFERFLDQEMAGYHDGRDQPARPSTSRLSPHLHFGEISPRQIWHGVHQRMQQVKKPGQMAGAETFINELIWREFAYHLLYHFPHTTEQPLDPRFRGFPWAANYEELLRAWQRGQTGVPIVDAGMRELWQTGWMHNRVRMIVASYLTKNLLIPWQEGARWFWNTLLDADLASNTLGWQWTAGCGADAAPFFRIFNPVLQGQRYDAAGDYVRRWVPELTQMPNLYLHQPWAATQTMRLQAGVSLGENYPHPIVELAGSRVRALEAHASMRNRFADEPPSV